MVVLNKIYTRTGDDGTTALGTGERRKKYDLRIAAYGTIDEANAAIGVARLHTAHDAELDAALARIQNDLFDVGADLCTPGKGQRARRRAAHRDRQAGRVARSRDRPLQCGACAAALLRAAGRQRGGGPSASRPHHLPARRAADRRAQGPSRTRASRAEVLKYVNRLSDFLFVASRYANGKGAGDVLWKPGENR